MINSVNVTLTKSDDGTISLPTFLLYSSQPHADLLTLSRFVITAVGRLKGDQVRIDLALPDPAVRLGTFDLHRVQAAEYQARNRVSGGVQLMVVRDTPATKDQHSLFLKAFYVDWMGMLGRDAIPPDADRVAPVSALGTYRARQLRKKRLFRDAIQAVLDEVTFATAHAEAVLSPFVAPALHEVGLVAESLGNDQAWEYFETITLMVYPNCHDALISMALMSLNDPQRSLPLLGRAYAIRPREDELRLFVQTFARHGINNRQAVQEAIRVHAQQTDLNEPLFYDANGLPLTVAPGEVIAHLRALLSEVV